MLRSTGSCDESSEPSRVCTAPPAHVKELKNFADIESHTSVITLFHGEDR